MMTKPNIQSTKRLPVALIENISFHDIRLNTALRAFSAELVRLPGDMGSVSLQGTDVSSVSSQYALATRLYNSKWVNYDFFYNSFLN